MVGDWVDITIHVCTVGKLQLLDEWGSSCPLAIRGSRRHPDCSSHGVIGEGVCDQIHCHTTWKGFMEVRCHLSQSLTKLPNFFPTLYFPIADFVFNTAEARHVLGLYNTYLFPGFVSPSKSIIIMIERDQDEREGGEFLSQSNGAGSSHGAFRPGHASWPSDICEKGRFVDEETLHRCWEPLSFVRAPLGSKIFELYTTNFV